MATETPAKPDRRVWRASTTAPVNIAVIKYWGKRDPTLNLPTNSSLSVTLTQSSLRAHTTAACSALFPSSSLHLNNTPQDLTTPRTSACLRALRAHRQAMEQSNPDLPPLSSMHLRIVSANNFPTAAGLASSAAGFAALVRAIANLYELPLSPEDLSVIARQGSGSACRSLFGGYVAWYMGSAADGQDSRAAQVAPAAHWPSMRALILVVSAAKKDVPSTAGMQATVATSSLFASRAAEVVPTRMRQMEAAVREKDFGVFASLTMRDSNTFHACCADTWPPIFYMTDVSRACVRMVEAVNQGAGDMVCCYTFDAGPNCVVFFEEANADYVLECFRAVTWNVDGWDGAGKRQRSGSQVAPRARSGSKASGAPSKLEVDEKVTSLLRDGVNRVILTGVGEGPEATKEHLVDDRGEIITVGS